MTSLISILIAAAMAAASVLDGAQNPTYSPDSSRIAFTRGGDLYVLALPDSSLTRLTFDGYGTDTGTNSGRGASERRILNGYASWVYYEEIFGRPSQYKAFWWSPDSRKLAFYRFDETDVCVFPIYSPFTADSTAAQVGRLNNTRYPKAGTVNPSVRIGFFDLEEASGPVWADFPEADQYFGTPFWGADSKALYVQWEPRRQNTLKLYRVAAADGSKVQVYSETYPTWVEWIEGMLFGEQGLYMARNFETGWEQIYYLSYDGKVFTRLTDGCNWNISLLKVDETRRQLWFSAKRDSRLHESLYRMKLPVRMAAGARMAKGARMTVPVPLTDPDFYARKVKIKGDSISVELSTSAVPAAAVTVPLYSAKPVSHPGTEHPAGGLDKFRTPDGRPATSEDRPVPEVIKIENDGFDLYGLISYPRDFDRTKKYPVLMTVYGGPGTAYVRDWWENRDASNRWCYENGIIYMVVDPRSSGENGRRGMDEAFRRMTVIELQDYIAWAKYMQALPYVKADRIGLDGFSFGGTTTSMLVLRYPEYFHCGIAGGGVYDWRLYDSHYTERFMDTPEANPEGYRTASVLSYAPYSSKYEPGCLKLTHGTGDDNVHFQNTLVFIDVLQRHNIVFDLMLYPDGMHGYRGAQHKHDVTDASAFWREHLLK